MTTLRTLETLVALTHPDVLADLDTVLFTDRANPMMRARNRVYQILGDDAMGHLYYHTLCVKKEETWKYKEALIVTVASKSSVETIRDACDEYIAYKRRAARTAARKR